MAAASWLKYVHRAHFSQPKSSRKLYRLIKRRKVGRIVEIGLGNVDQTQKLIEVAQRFASDKEVTYSGLDWFDMRAGDVPVLRIKEAHRELQATSAKIRLVPGDPIRSLPAVANDLVGTDLLIVASIVNFQALASAWYFVPRMLHGQSAVVRELARDDGQSEFELLSSNALAALVNARSVGRAA